MDTPATTHTVTVTAHQSDWQSTLALILQLIAQLAPIVIPVIQLIPSAEGTKPLVTVTPQEPAA